MIGISRKIASNTLHDSSSDSDSADHRVGPVLSPRHLQAVYEVMSVLFSPFPAKR
jgi:hypothetical protein